MKSLFSSAIKMPCSKGVSHNMGEAYKKEGRRFITPFSSNPNNKSAPVFFLGV